MLLLTSVSVSNNLIIINGIGLDVGQVTPLIGGRAVEVVSRTHNMIICASPSISGLADIKVQQIREFENPNVIFSNSLVVDIPRSVIPGKPFGVIPGLTIAEKESLLFGQFVDDDSSSSESTESESSTSKSSAFLPSFARDITWSVTRSGGAGPFVEGGIDGTVNSNEARKTDLPLVGSLWMIEEDQSNLIEINPNGVGWNISGGTTTEPSEVGPTSHGVVRLTATNSTSQCFFQNITGSRYYIAQIRIRASSGADPYVQMYNDTSFANIASIGYIVSGPGSVVSDSGQGIRITGLSSTQWTHAAIFTYSATASHNTSLRIYGGVGTAVIGSYVDLEKSIQFVNSFVLTPTTIIDSFSTRGDEIIIGNYDPISPSAFSVFAACKMGYKDLSVYSAISSPPSLQAVGPVLHIPDGASDTTVYVNLFFTQNSFPPFDKPYILYSVGSSVSQLFEHPKPLEVFSVGVTFDGVTAKIYYNGVYKQSFVPFTTPVNNLDTIGLGTYTFSPNNEKFNGAVTAPLIYDYVLTDSDMLDLHNDQVVGMPEAEDFSSESSESTSSSTSLSSGTSSSTSLSSGTSSDSTSSDSTSSDSTSSTSTNSSSISTSSDSTVVDVSSSSSDTSLSLDSANYTGFSVIQFEGGLNGVVGVHTDIPVLLTENNLPPVMINPTSGNSAKPNGGDIRFSSDPAGNNILPLEIVKFNIGSLSADSSSSESSASSNDGLSPGFETNIEMYVKVPKLEAGSTIYVWWGNPYVEQPDSNAPNGSFAVWSDYKFVNHGNDLINKVNGDSYFAISATPPEIRRNGKINNGIDLNTTGQYAVWNVSGGGTDTNTTVQMWADRYRKVSGGAYNVLRMLNPSSSFNMYFITVADAVSASTWDFRVSYATSSGTVNVTPPVTNRLSGWHFLTSTFQSKPSIASNAIKIYRDASLINSNIFPNSETDMQEYQELVIGDGTTPRSMVDETRVIDQLFSQDRVTTEYNMVEYNSTFTSLEDISSSSSSTANILTSSSSSSSVSNLSPNDISGVSAWWRSDAGTVGSPVSSWTDQVSSIVATQGTSTSRATIGDPLNGINGLVFDGVNDRYDTNTPNVINSAQYTIMAVVNITAPFNSSFKEIISNWDGSIAAKSLFFGINAGSSAYTIRVTDDFQTTGTINAGYHIITAVVKSDDIDVYVDGEFFESLGSAPNARAFITDFWIGSQGSLFGEFWNGTIYEIITINRDVNSDELDALHEYTCNKYGLCRVSSSSSSDSSSQSSSSDSSSSDSSSQSSSSDSSGQSSSSDSSSQST